MVIIINNHIAEHHLQTNHRIAWDSAKCINYVQHKIQSMTHSGKLVNKLTPVEQTPLNCALQLPAPHNNLLTTSTEQTSNRHFTYLQFRPTDF